MWLEAGWFRIADYPGISSYLVSARVGMEVHGPLWHTPLIVDSIAHSVNEARSDTTILKSRPDFLYANQALNSNEGIRFVHKKLLPWRP